MTIPIDLGMLETLNPAIISAVALALGAVSLLGTDHPIIKRVTWPVILLMVCLGAFSVFLQAHQEYGNERQKAEERQNNEREKLELLARIGRLTSQMEALQANQVFHPKPEPAIKVVSTFVDPTIRVGLPRKLHFTVQNTTGGILATRNRALASMLYVDDFNYFVQNSDAGEDMAYKSLLAKPFAGRQEITTANDGQYDFLLETKALSESEVAAFRAGKVVVYFLGEIKDASKGNRIFEICAFVAPDGQIFSCHRHNFP